MTRQSINLGLDLEPANWMKDARCQEFDPEQWFSPSPIETRLAIELCRSCPVRYRCLDFALKTHSDHGVFGAHTEKERALMRRAAAQRKRAS
jgi:WhiB family redox-sensing transcriptional regulator